ncbi:MAG: hypothetical protein LBK66_07835, partial [Spirochaetaceae bacterium]|nr:hypothetical protein [Spirochaetaceae bacterium]
GDVLEITGLYALLDDLSGDASGESLSMPVFNKTKGETYAMRLDAPPPASGFKCAPRQRPHSKLCSVP